MNAFKLEEQLPDSRNGTMEGACECTGRPDAQGLRASLNDQSAQGRTFIYAFISPLLVFLNGVETMSFSLISQQPLRHLLALAAICNCALQAFKH